MQPLVIANLTARALRRGEGTRAWVAERCRGRARLFETQTVGELDQAMREGLAARPPLVVLAGGDGSFMAGVTALVREIGAQDLPKIGLLPLGTVGTVARNLGARGRPRELLERWLAHPEEAHALPRATLRVEAERGGHTEARVGFIVGTGLVARFFEVYEQEGAGGLPHAARIVLRVFSESLAGGPFARRILSPIPCELSVEGQLSPLPGVSLLCAAVVRDLGLSMRVCYRAQEEPERFHLVASGLPPRKLGPRAPLVMLGKNIGGEHHVDQLTRDFEVRFPRGQGPYVLDGDTFYAERFKVTAGPVLPIIGDPVLPPR